MCATSCNFQAPLPHYRSGSHALCNAWCTDHPFANAVVVQLQNAPDITKISSNSREKIGQKLSKLLPLGLQSQTQIPVAVSYSILGFFQLALLLVPLSAHFVGGPTAGLTIRLRLTGLHPRATDFYGLLETPKGSQFLVVPNLVRASFFLACTV